MIRLLSWCLLTVLCVGCGDEPSGESGSVATPLTAAQLAQLGQRALEEVNMGHQNSAELAFHLAPFPAKQGYFVDNKLGRHAVGFVKQCHYNQENSSVLHYSTFGNGILQQSLSNTQKMRKRKELK